MSVMQLWNGAPDGDATQAQLAESGLTDGLPVVPPTRERVFRMLGLLTAEEFVCDEPLLFNQVTWLDLAVNAVMAGCPPGVLPLLAAAVEALSAPEFNLLGVGTTTGNAAPVIIVNGPIARQLGMNAAANALGPGNRANASIGRALAFLLRNVGGATPGEVDMATLGQPAKYTCCFAENEADSPWSSLAEERGFARDDNVVTVFGAAGLVEMVDSTSHTGAELATTYAQSLLMAGQCGSADYVGGGEPLLILPPEIVQIFGNDGYTKERVKQAIFERAEMPLERLAPAVAERIRVGHGKGGPHTLDHLKIAARAEDLLLVVAGGVGIKAAYLPEWSASKAVSRKLRAG